jgi:hypothetical protein
MAENTFIHGHFRIFIQQRTNLCFVHFCKKKQCAILPNPYFTAIQKEA